MARATLKDLGIAFEMERAPSRAFALSDPDERKPDDGDPVGRPLLKSRRGSGCR